MSSVTMYEIRKMEEQKNERPCDTCIHYVTKDRQGANVGSASMRKGDVIEQMAGQMTIFDFIKPTDDRLTVLERILASGSQYSCGKIRIFALWKCERYPGVRSKWLAKEYGIGGRTIEINNRRGFVDFDGKGVHISYFDGDGKENYEWSVVERCIGGLIERGAYLTKDENERWQEIADRYGDDIPYPDAAYRYPDNPVVSR